MDVVQGNGVPTSMSQVDNVNSLQSGKDFDLKNNPDMPLDKVRTTEFLQFTGQLSWATQQTLPDLLFEVLA